MTRFVGTPLRGTEFANAGDEAISARVTTDTYPRIRIDAGGRITWASGSATGDTTLYRDSANVLKTDDVLQAASGVITLTTTGAPTVGIADGALAVDTQNNAFYYRSGGQWIQVSVEIESINDIADVVITTPKSGQLLQFDGTNWVNAVSPSNEPIGHEDKTQSTMSFDESTRTFSIAPVGASFTVWCTGVRYVKTTAQTVQIPDTSGLYYIYFNSSGSLAYKTTYFTWETDTPTAYIYWNEVDNKAYFFADERHGITLDWATHEYLHRTRGASIANGFGVSSYIIDGDGSSEDHAKFDLADGTFFDEDLQVDITHSATPTANTWEQVLQGDAEIPVFYRSNNHWKKDQATEFAFKQGTSRPQYNLYSAPNWSPVDVDNNKFLISWIIATNNLSEPVIAIMGQASYNTIGAAEAAVWETLNLDGFPIVEFRPLHKVVFQGTDSFTNSVNAAIRGIYDLRRVSSGGDAVASTPVSDHGSMTGLADDDHTQYLNEARHGSLDHSGVMGTVVLGDISDISISSPVDGQILIYNGTDWVNQNNEGGVSDLDGGTSFDEIYEAEITNQVEATYDGGTP
jgi:hypothetical protein